MRKIFKPEHVIKSGTVQIPDVEFKYPEFDPEEEPEEVKVVKAYKAQMRKEAENEVRAELFGEVGRKKLAAQREYEEIIRNARMEAASIIREAEEKAVSITNAANEKAAEIHREAFEEGKKKGLEEKSHELQELADKISRTLDVLRADEEEYFEKYAVELKHLAVEMAGKIICQKVEEDELFMYNIIKTAVKSIRDVSWIKAEVSDQLAGYIDTMESEFSSSGQRVEFVIREDAPKDTCVLNHSDGVVIATLSEQLENLREFVQRLDRGECNEDAP